MDLNEMEAIATPLAGGTTSLGIPYPGASDPVAQGAANMQAMATKIDSLLSAFPSARRLFFYQTGSQWSIPNNAESAVISSGSVTIPANAGATYIRFSCAYQNAPGTNYARLYVDSTLTFDNLARAQAVVCPCNFWVEHGGLAAGSSHTFQFNLVTSGASSAGIWAPYYQFEIGCLLTHPVTELDEVEAQTIYTSDPGDLWEGPFAPFEEGQNEVGFDYVPTMPAERPDADPDHDYPPVPV